MVGALAPSDGTASAGLPIPVLLPVIERYRAQDIPKYFRGDSAFALPKLLRLLAKEGFRYAIRLRSNAVLQRKIAHLLKRPVARRRAGCGNSGAGSNAVRSSSGWEIRCPGPFGRIRWA